MLPIYHIIKVFAAMIARTQTKIIGRRNGRKRDVVDGKVQCLLCEEWKPLEEFPRINNGRKGLSGHESRCLPCRRLAFRVRNQNISITEYRRMLTEHDGKCAVCGSSDNLSVDHCHQTGRLRGLLCRHCNTAIGVFGERPQDLRRAAEYLEYWQRRHTDQPQTQGDLVRLRRMDEVQARRVGTGRLFGK